MTAAGSVIACTYHAVVDWHGHTYYTALHLPLPACPLLKGVQHHNCIQLHTTAEIPRGVLLAYTGHSGCSSPGCGIYDEGNLLCLCHCHLGLLPSGHCRICSLWQPSQCRCAAVGVKTSGAHSSGQLHGGHSYSCQLSGRLLHARLDLAAYIHKCMFPFHANNQ